MPQKISFWKVGIAMGLVIGVYCCALLSPLRNGLVAWVTTGRPTIQTDDQAGNNVTTVDMARDIQDLHATQVGQTRLADDKRIPAACSTKSRLLRIERACSHMTSQQRTAEYHNRKDLQMFVNPAKRVFSCSAPKAGSHTLQYYFSDINTQNNWTIRHSKNLGNGNIAKDKFQALSNIFKQWDDVEGFHRVEDIPITEVQRLFQHYTKIIPVRHPLQRFVSAFYARGLGATFEEFIQKAVDGHFNRHWIQSYILCAPCTLGYDFVIKIETLEEDQEMLNERFGWTATLGHGNINKKVNFTESANKDHFKYDKFLKDFEQENPKSFDQLLEYLQPDFDLFGYSWTENGSQCYNINENCC